MKLGDNATPGCVRGHLSVRRALTRVLSNPPPPPAWTPPRRCLRRIGEGSERVARPGGKLSGLNFKSMLHTSCSSCSYFQRAGLRHHWGGGVIRPCGRCYCSGAPRRAGRELDDRHEPPSGV